MQLRRNFQITAHNEIIQKRLVYRGHFILNEIKTSPKGLISVNKLALNRLQDCKGFLETIVIVTSDTFCLFVYYFNTNNLKYINQQKWGVEPKNCDSHVKKCLKQGVAQEYKNHFFGPFANQ